ncbi:NAD(+) diphosphatase [soil metagenome]
MTFAFERALHDRVAERRKGDWDTPDARVIVVAGDLVGTDDDGLRFFDRADAPVGDLALLGDIGGTTYLAVLVDKVPDEAKPLSLRQIGLALDAWQGSLAVHAVGLSQWHLKHTHCAQCGALTEVAQAGHTRVCPACGAEHFPRTDPAVIMLITDDHDRALLGRNPHWPPTTFSTLAGFVEPGESLDDAVRREVFEEVGVTVGEVTYGSSQPWPFPSSLMLGFFGKAETSDIHVDAEEISEARWFTRNEIDTLIASGELKVPGELSVSGWLIRTWHGGDIDSTW